MDVAVLGAGRRGRKIAGRCAVAGHDVALRGEDANEVMDTVDALERAHGTAASDRVTGTTGLESAVTDAAVVIEATDGDVAAKRDLLATVEEFVDEETLLATSHPSAAVTAVAAGLLHPGRAVGLHFVESVAESASEANVDTAGLVEIVVADQTTSDALNRAKAFVDELDATAIVVGDAPGFATTRLDLALVVEAARMVEEGVVSVEDVDRSMTVGRNHPRGPLQLADELGLHQVVAGLEDLADRLDGRFAPPGILHEKVAAGATGKRAGEGFYIWENGEPVEPAEPDPTVPTRDASVRGPER